VKRFLEAARYLFNTKGFGATSINDLVDCLQASRKGAYNFHFSARMPFGLTVLEEARNSFMDFLADSLYRR